MAFPSIATINLSLLTSAVSTANFGTPIFLTTHRNFVERVREYNSMTDVSSDFGETSPAYKAAAAFFGQTPKPQSFKVGRINSTATLTPFPADEGEDYGFYVGVNSDTTALVYITAGAEDDEEDIVDNLISTFNALYDDFVTASKNGSGESTTLTLTPNSPTDSFVLGNMLNMTFTLATSETVADAYAACKEEDEQFYFVTSEFRSEANVLSLASTVSADERLYFVGLAEQTSLATIGTPATDVAGKLFELNYDRVITLFKENAATEYPELAYIGRFCTYEPGTADWYAKVLSGVGLSLNPATGKPISSTQQNNLLARNCNAIVPEGGLAVVKMGRTVSGQNIDIVWFRDFLAARLKEGYQTWRINKLKIPYDQVGIDSAENVFKGICDRYVSTQQRPHAISSYETNFPRRDDVSFNDVATGVLRAAATIYLTGSILTVVLDGVLTFDAEF